MKRKIVIGALVAVTMFGGAHFARAEQGAGPAGEEWAGGNSAPLIDRLAKALDLSDVQKEKISAILKAEREKIAPLRQQMAENREQLRQAALAVPFDESAVRAIAAKAAPLVTELMVSGARVKNGINALLTPEQRTQAEKLRMLMGPRPGHMLHFGFEE
jgi:periplasmic protein CpxP/Spy